ncbi:hypothetical protein DXT96_07445 [Agrobacterium sp. ICMP 6402]|uniref:hypothetical protein n=1 Tax=Agrobacterium sp. ICMP 6402 TaxID=2292443 RepID=UPI001294CD97|nr:hypothetical protein [Agrobacterium sp. ICMP 6402]MQB09688.1 hypothetical protein [Agrobacterium sp. ICMP 6402]
MSYKAWGDGDNDPDWRDDAIEHGWWDPDDISQALKDTWLEIERQQSQEGYTDAHDDEVNKQGELAWAAACYAVAGGAENPASCVIGMRGIPHALWPWTLESFKPKDRRRDLIRAAALLIREIERLDRAEAKS